MLHGVQRGPICNGGHFARAAYGAVKRPWAPGQLYVKWGAYYGRWRRRMVAGQSAASARSRARGESGRSHSRRGGTRPAAADRGGGSRPPGRRSNGPATVDEVADELRERLDIEGARLSYRQNCESMQRVHVSPAHRQATRGHRQARGRRAACARDAQARTRAEDSAQRHDVPALRFCARRESGWAAPIRSRGRAAAAATRGDADPDLQFLTFAELDAVIAAIPDRTVDRDALGPVLRLVILAAATTGLRQSELLGLRWQHVDMRAQRIRVRNAWVRDEHSGEGKSDLSTKRSVPMTDRLAAELKRWRLRTVFSDDEDLVFAHPELGVDWTGRKSRAGSRLPASRPVCAQIRFHDLRHTFATTLAAAGVPLRTSRSTLATPTSRRRRFTRTTRRRHARSRSSTRRLDCPNGRTGRVGAQARCGRDGISAGVQCHGAASKAADRLSSWWSWPRTVCQDCQVMRRMTSVIARPMSGSAIGSAERDDRRAEAMTASET